VSGPVFQNLVGAKGLKPMHGVHCKVENLTTPFTEE